MKGTGTMRGTKEGWRMRVTKGKEMLVDLKRVLARLDVDLLSSEA